MKRRSFLTNTLAGFAAIGPGLLFFKDALAAWRQSLMIEPDVTKASNTIAGGIGSMSDKIKIKAPEVAENGAVVPIDVDATDLGNVDSISILFDSNPRAVGAVFNMSDSAASFVATRIKLGKSGHVIALVKAGDKVYKNQKEIKVTIGGCGG